MAQTLEHNKAVTTVVPVSIPTFDDDLAIIQKLDDEPNDVGGLTATELKAKFDEGNVTAQQYINNVLIPTVVADGLTEQARQVAEAERVTNEIERVGNEEARASAEKERELAIAKVENMTATATTLPAGSPATAEIVPDPATGAYNVKLGIPAGRDGYGAGDMLASTYDTTGKRQDVFKYSDTKISEHNSSTNAHADIRAALDGKAPAGYGLGTGGAECYDCNDVVDNGWYSCAAVANAPSETNYGWMIVSSRSGAGGQVRQDYYTSLGNPTHYHRYLADGVWSDWVCDDISYGTTDLTAGSSPLRSGQLYFVYE